jgi:RNA polymerase sigma-70 factor (ECF subfamily)
MRYLTAGGQPALAAYAPGPGGRHLRHSLPVFTVPGGRVHFGTLAPSDAR